jgi:hypothetical protein
MRAGVAGFQVSDEIRQGPDAARVQLQQLRYVRFLYVPSGPRILQVVSRLDERAFGNPGELGELARAESSEPFSDVPWGGTRGVADLLSKPKVPGDGSRTNPLENTVPQLDAQLPGIDVFIPPKSCHAKGDGTTSATQKS